MTDRKQWVVAPFFWYAERLLAKRFDGVGLLKSSFASLDELSRADKAIIYSTHSSWWDVMIGVLVAKRTRLQLFAPMDQDQLEKYSTLKSIGMIGVSESKPLPFMRTVKKIFSSGERTGLWITPQATFVCNRQEQPPFKRGLEFIAKSNPDVPLFRVAINYEFWNESRPVATLSIRRAESLDDLEGQLTHQTRELLQSSSQRVRKDWYWLIESKPQSVWIQDATARLKARVLGRAYNAGHLR
jgi:hypothetical protein